MNIEYLLDILKNRGYISIQDDRNLHGRASVGWVKTQQNC